MLTTLLAIYGALLSSVLGYLQWQRGRRRLAITAVPAINVNIEPQGKWVRVSLQNRGHEPIFLRSVHLQSRTKRKDLGRFGFKGLIKHRRWRRSWWYLGSEVPEGTIFDRDFPTNLEPGRSLVVWVPSSELEALETRADQGDLRLLVMDEWDRSFQSPRLPTW